MVEHVGDLNEATEEKKKGRQPYDTTELKASNKNAINADGLLMIAPAGFNFRLHETMKKEDFATESVYLRYQSLVASSKAEFFAEKSAELTGKADRLEKFGSESARKAATKLARAKKTMSDLRAQLVESGMSEEELDALIEDM